MRFSPKKFIKVDWLTYSDKFHDVNQTLSFWEQAFSNFSPCPGRFRYKNGYRSDAGFQIFYDGIDYTDCSLDQSDYLGKSGVCVNIPGSATNFLYSKGLSLEDFLKNTLIKYPYYHISRLDIAFDYVVHDPEDRFPYDKLIDSLDNGYFCSKVNRNGKSIRIIKGIDPNGLFDDPIATCYIGSSQSDIMLRIYNKLAEQSLKRDGLVYSDVWGDGQTPVQWLRFEFQLRNDRANAFAGALASDSLDNVFFGVLNQFIRFLDPVRSESNINKSIVPTSDWWDQFTELFGKLKLCVHRELEPEVSPQRLLRFMRNFCKPAYTFSKLFGYNALLAFVANGVEGLPDKYKLLINDNKNNYDKSAYFIKTFQSVFGATPYAF